jgi:alkanesulfonate monooxygenase SsuD/methylene tetrahydromethanopterin reductase-like flavin-dependent oxidoreductase (luciferase family)
MAGITRHALIRRTEEEAYALARRAWAVFGEHWSATSLRLPDGRFAPLQRPFDAMQAAGGRFLVGSPESIVHELDGVVRELCDKPTRYIAPAFQWGDLTFDESLESLELFASEVMPRLREVAASRLAGAPPCPTS